MNATYHIIPVTICILCLAFDIYNFTTSDHSLLYKFFLNSVMGLVLFIIFSFTAPGLFPINAYTVLISGVTGVPGVIALILLL